MSKENSRFLGYLVSLICLFGPTLFFCIFGGVNWSAYNKTNYPDWKFVTNCTVTNTKVKDSICTITVGTLIFWNLTLQIEYPKNNQTNQTVEAKSPQLDKKKCHEYDVYESVNYY